MSHIDRQRFKSIGYVGKDERDKRYGGRRGVDDRGRGGEGGGGRPMVGQTDQMVRVRVREEVDRISDTVLVGEVVDIERRVRNATRTLRRHAASAAVAVAVAVAAAVVSMSVTVNGAGPCGKPWSIVSGRAEQTS